MRTLRTSTLPLSAPFAWLGLLTLACGGDAGDPEAAGDAAHGDAASDTSDAGADEEDWAADSGDGAPDADAGADASDGPDALGDAPAEAGDAPADEEVYVPPPLPERPWDITLPGPYAVGYRVLDVRYVPRGESEERRITAAVWYPSRDPSGRRAYYAGFFPRNHVWENATVAPDGPFPVLLFSHGSSSFAEQSFFMTEHFASHGWIVLAPNHVGNTMFDDADILPPEAFLRRPQDVSQTLDAALALPGDDPLHGQLGDDIAMTGHSFGGYTSIAVAGASFAVDDVIAGCTDGTVPDFICEAVTDQALEVLREGLGDPRVGVAIPQAPGGMQVFGTAGVAEIDLPVLLMTGQLDRTTPNEEEGDVAWEGLDGSGDMRADFANGGHFTFSNLCEFLPTLGEDDGCGEGFMPPDESYRVINTFAMAFARAHLFGDGSVQGYLDGSTIVSGDVELSWKAEP